MNNIEDVDCVNPLLTYFKKEKCPASYSQRKEVYYQNLKKMNKIFPNTEIKGSRNTIRNQLEFLK